MKKRRPIPVLKKDAWKAFADWIKRRDCKDGYTTCISCDNKYLCGSDAINAGHLIHGKWKYIGFDERNVNAQCVYCNVGYSGNEYQYAIRLARKIGQDQVDELYSLRKKKFSASREYIEGLIERYK